jgi:protein involved in polysaccharide export with SLBB domain
MSVSNILVLAGGVTQTGTLRNIKLQREGALIDSLDLYPLITGHGNVKSLKILDNDIIVVPPRGKTVALTGAVLTPAYFEVTEKNSVQSILEFAGGITPRGSNQVVIARTNGVNKYISQDQYLAEIVMNGDSLIVPRKWKQNNYVSVSVNNRPMVTLPWIEDISFNAILNFVQVDLDKIKHVELIRRSKEDGIQRPYSFDMNQNDSFIFLPSDHLSIQFFERNTPLKTVIVKGEVNSPGIYSLINNKETINDILSRAGGLQATSDIKNVIVKRDTLFFGSKTGNLVLTPRDTVIAMPILGTVMVEGEVHNPGNLAWVGNNSAKDYLQFAGGLTAFGDKKHIVYITPYGEATRINARSNISILPGSVIRVSEKPLAEQNARVDRFQQISSLVTTLVSIAILANTTK